MKMTRGTAKIKVDGRAWICEVIACTRDNSMKDERVSEIEKEIQRLFGTWIKTKIEDK